MNKYLACAIVVLMLAVGVVVLNQHSTLQSDSEPSGSNTKLPTIDEGGATLPTPQSGWTTYTNTDLGVVFEYPEKWGTIAMETGKGCAAYLGHYTEAELEDMKAQLATGSLCAFSTLNVRARGASPADFGATILGASTPLYAQYPIPKGGTWFTEAITVALDKNPMSRYADPNQCKLFKNKQGVDMVRCSSVTEGGDGGTFDRNVFYIFSTRSSYHGFVLSSARLEASTASDFDLLVDSFRFIH